MKMTSTDFDTIWLSSAICQNHLSSRRHARNHSQAIALRMPGGKHRSSLGPSPPHHQVPTAMGKIVKCRECGKSYRDLEELEDLRDNDSTCLVCNGTIEVAD